MHLRLYLSKLSLLLIGLILVLLPACQDNQNKSKLEQAAQLLHNDKEGQALDILKQCGNFTSKADSMRYLLLYMDAAQKKGRKFQSADEAVLNKVTQYYMKEGTANDKVYACYVCGRMYDDLRWPTEALRWYQKALTLADTLSTDCDLKLVARVYGQMAEVSGYRVSEREFVALLQQAAYWSQKADDKYLEADILFSYADIYADDNPQMAAQYIKKALNIYKAFGYSNDWADGKLEAAKIWMNMDSLSKAQKCIAQFEEHYNSVQRSKNEFETERRLAYWQTKAVYYEKTSAADSAIYYNRLIIDQDSLTYKLDAYVRLADIYSLEGKKDSTIKYLNLAANEKYTDYEKDLGSQMQELQSNFDITTEREAALKTRNQLHRLVNWGVSVLIALTCVALGLYWKKRKKQQVLELHALKHVEIENFSKLLRERMDESGECAPADQNDRISKKVAEESSKIDAQLSDEELEQMRINYLQSTAVVKHLAEKAQKNESADEAELDALYEEIAKVAQPVAILLKHKRAIMQSTDWQLCLLIMADMKPKAIKTLINCSSSKISMRTRISEKLFPEKVLSGVTEFDTMLRTWRGE